MQQWWPAVIASGVATGAVTLIYFLIRKMVMDAMLRMEASLKDVWKSMDNIRDKYMEEKTHDILCGKNALEIEKMFKECLKKHADNVFEHIRTHRQEVERKLEDALKKVQDRDGEQ